MNIANLPANFAQSRLFLLNIANNGNVPIQTRMENLQNATWAFNRANIRNLPVIINVADPVEYEVFGLPTNKQKLWVEKF